MVCIESVSTVSLTVFFAVVTVSSGPLVHVGNRPVPAASSGSGTIFNISQKQNRERRTLGGGSAAGNRGRDQAADESKGRQTDDENRHTVRESHGTDERT